LKPLKGADATTYAALRSHCLQSYPAYEIIFGVNDESDPAIPLVHRLTAEFPSLPIQLVVCAEVLGANRKVSNLIYMLRQAKHSWLLVNDADINVGPEYLRNVMCRFADNAIGMVTCLYRGRPSLTLGSRLEALGIATDFIPGVLTAALIERGLHFGLGSTLAIQREALDSIGGFEAIADYLADDYQLGERIAAAGFKIALAREIVETAIPAYSFAQFWQHQLRWARTMRVSRPGGYAGMLLTFALPWSILLAIVAPRHWWSWAVVAAAILVRSTTTTIVGRTVLRDRTIISNLALLPLRDLLAPFVWAWSFAGNNVTWRGDTFRIRQGKLIRMGSARKKNASSAEEMGTGAQRR
jgi:ceramide glucosyltransferase